MNVREVSLTLGLITIINEQEGQACELSHENGSLIPLHSMLDMLCVIKNYKYGDEKVRWFYIRNMTRSMNNLSLGSGSAVS
jgi:hypothetical protein